MKTNIVKWTALAATSMALIGCDLFGSDDSESKDLKVSSVTIAPGTAAPSTSVELKFSVESDAELALVGIEVFRKDTAGVVTDTLEMDDQFTYNYVTPAGKEELTDETVTIAVNADACGADYDFKVTAVNATGSQSQTASLTVDAPACSDEVDMPLGAAKSGVVNNVQGPDQGAFDLVKGEGVSSSGDAAVKDLLDITATSDLGSGNGFKATLSSGNESVFAVVTDLDFATATAMQLAASMEAAEKSFALETPVLKVGDVVLVGLGGDRGAAVLKITEVVLTTDDNKDMIKFDYKLLTFEEEM